MAFEEQLPQWEEEGTQPPQSKRVEGWLPNEKPPASWFNWLFHRAYKALQELQMKAAEKADVGDMSSVPTTAKDAAGAITELHGEIGNVSDVAAAAQSTAEAAQTTANNHASRHASGGADPLTPGDIGAVAKSGDTMTGSLVFSGSLSHLQFTQGPNQPATADVDFPEVGSQFGEARFFRYTNTSNNGLAFRILKGDGTNTTSFGVYPQRNYILLWDDTRLHVDAFNPEGSLTNPPGSLVLRTDGAGGPYYKASGTGNTGWKEMWHAGNLPVEYGNWTPIVRGADVAGSPVYAVRQGSYTKLGKFVFATAYLTFTKDANMSGNVLISGLPFIISGNDGSGMISAIRGIDIESTGYRSVTLSVFGGVDYVTIRKHKLDDTSIESTVTSDDLLSEVILRIGMTYKTI